MNLQRVALSHVVASGQPRPLITLDVDKLSASIKAMGLIQPITVMPCTVIHGTAQPGFRIVAGHHRVAACRALGWTEIDALVIEGESDLQTELIEIDENLCRSELTASQRTSYTKRRKQIWEALHPAETNQRFESVFDAIGVEAEIQVRQAVAPEFIATGYKQPPKQTKGFAASTAALTGESVRSIQRSVARADALGDDTLTKITGTSLDSGTQMDALAKLPAPERAVLVERAAAGQQVSARPAKASGADLHRTGNSKLADISKSINRALRAILDDAGSLSVEEFSAFVKAETKKATHDEIELLSETVNYFETFLNGIQA